MTPEYKKKVSIASKKTKIESLRPKPETGILWSPLDFQIPKQLPLPSPMSIGTLTISSLSIPKEGSTKGLLGKRDWLNRSNLDLGSAPNELGLKEGIKNVEFCTLINSYSSKNLTLISDLPQGAVEFENVCTHNLSKNENLVKKS